MKRLNTLRLRQNGHHFAEDIFECIFLNGIFLNGIFLNEIFLIKISLKFVPKGPINNIPALGQIMAKCCSSDKPLSEPMMVRLPTHICIPQPQWMRQDKNYVWIFFLSTPQVPVHKSETWWSQCLLMASYQRIHAGVFAWNMFKTTPRIISVQLPFGSHGKHKREWMLLCKWNVN